MPSYNEYLVNFLRCGGGIPPKSPYNFKATCTKTMKYRITHVTRYDYSESVSLCHNLAHLKLRQQPSQLNIISQIRIEPFPAVAREFRDSFGNSVNYFAVQQAHKQLLITATSEVDITPIHVQTADTTWPTLEMWGGGPPPHPHDNAIDSAWNNVSLALSRENNEARSEACMFTLDSPFIKASDTLRDYALPAFPLGRPLLEGVMDLMGNIHKDFTYDPTSTEVATPVEEVLIKRRGVCQDFAHIAIGCLRSLGIPARYVSGYLETIPPPGKPKLRGADASHAWFAAYIPGIGWLDFDPTNNSRPGEQHITTAVGRDFGDVTPIKGVLYGGGEHKLYVSVDVERI